MQVKPMQVYCLLGYNAYFLQVLMGDCLDQLLCQRITTVYMTVPDCNIIYPVVGVPDVATIRTIWG